MRPWRALVLAVCAAAGPVLAQPAEPRVVELRVEKQRLVGGPATVRVPQGSEFELRWTVDRPVTLHLHGYDIEVDAIPGVVAVMRLSARATGRFPVEIHDSGRGHGRPLLYVEVVPR